MKLETLQFAIRKLPKQYIWSPHSQHPQMTTSYSDSKITVREITASKMDVHNHFLTVHNARRHQRCWTCKLKVTISPRTQWIDKSWWNDLSLMLCPLPFLLLPSCDCVTFINVENMKENGGDKLVALHFSKSTEPICVFCSILPTVPKPNGKA